MRLLAMVAALTLAVPAPVAGAPSLASSGCQLFPADNVWHADVSRLPVHPRSGAYLAAMGPGAGIHADAGSGDGALLPRVLTVVLGLTAAVLAFRSFRRSHARHSRRR